MREHNMVLTFTSPPKCRQSVETAILLHCGGYTMWATHGAWLDPNKKTLRENMHRWEVSGPFLLVRRVLRDVKSVLAAAGEQAIWYEVRESDARCEDLTKGDPDVGPGDNRREA